jgi:hypothetical protein
LHRTSRRRRRRRRRLTLLLLLHLRLHQLLGLLRWRWLLLRRVGFRRSWWRVNVAGWPRRTEYGSRSTGWLREDVTARRRGVGWGGPGLGLGDLAEAIRIFEALKMLRLRLRLRGRGLWKIMRGLRRLRRERRGWLLLPDKSAGRHTGSCDDPSHGSANLRHLALLRYHLLLLLRRLGLRLRRLLLRLLTN